MYVVAGERRPIFYESDAFLYNLDDPIIGCFHLFSDIVIYIVCIRNLSIPDDDYSHATLIHIFS